MTLVLMAGLGKGFLAKRIAWSHAGPSAVIVVRSTAFSFAREFWSGAGVLVFLSAVAPRDCQRETVRGLFEQWSHHLLWPRGQVPW